tara:strand:+ start:210 stop:545 length:336 start_codon:yes stop_codon:yes gene_type:complete
MPKIRTPILRVVGEIARKDVINLERAEESYGDSWKKRGGIGAFMMLARKWDRLENQVEKHGCDIFHAVKGDQRQEGILDDIKDLRAYLLLVEAEMTIVLERTKKGLQVGQK